MNKIADRLSPAPEAVPAQGFRASLKALLRPAAFAALVSTLGACPESEDCGGQCYQVYKKCGDIAIALSHLTFPFNLLWVKKCGEEYDECRAACGGASATDATTTTDTAGTTTTDPTATSGTVGETSGGTAPGETTGIETTSTTGTDSTTTGSTTMDTTTSTTGDMTTGEVPYCGDGIIDAGEECDNGDQNREIIHPCDAKEGEKEPPQGEQCNKACKIVQCSPAQEEPEN